MPLGSLPAQASSAAYPRICLISGTRGRSRRSGGRRPRCKAPRSSGRGPPPDGTRRRAPPLPSSESRRRPAAGAGGAHPLARRYVECRRKPALARRTKFSSVCRRHDGGRPYRPLIERQTEFALDDHVPHPHDPATVANLGPLHRGHHNLKTAGLRGTVHAGSRNRFRDNGSTRPSPTSESRHRMTWAASGPAPSSAPSGSAPCSSRSRRRISPRTWRSVPCHACPRLGGPT